MRQNWGSFSAASRVLLCTYYVTHEGKAMSETTFTFRVDESLKTEFSTAAKARDRTGAQLLRDFMRDFVRQQEDAAAHDAWFRRQVQVGLDSANAGNLIPAAEVEAQFAGKRAATRRRLEASE
jgi:predicted transcriptional regulator